MSLIWHIFGPSNPLRRIEDANIGMHFANCHAFVELGTRLAVFTSIAISPKRLLLTGIYSLYNIRGVNPGCYAKAIA